MKPTVTYDPKGESGNIFAVAARAKQALEASHLVGSEEMQRRITAAQTYDEALRIVGEYVNLQQVVERRRR